jgi:hypothetical protein
MLGKSVVASYANRLGTGRVLSKSANGENNGLAARTKDEAEG